jgi:hypothetical protein
MQWSKYFGPICMLTFAHSTYIFRNLQRHYDFGNPRSTRPPSSLYIVWTIQYTVSGAREIKAQLKDSVLVCEA